MGKLEGKIVIITGGSAGIGRACVELFINEGATVIIADIKDKEGEDLAKILGDNATFKHTDVTIDSDVKGVVDFAVDNYGRLDCIMNNAGIPGVIISPFSIAWLKDGKIEDFPLKLIQKSLDSNLVVITHGDVCFDSIKGASILSGDTIAVYLARELSAEALFLGTDVDGVFEDDPRQNPQAKLISSISNSNKDRVLKRSGPSSATDVTGGMTKKISELITLSSSGTEIVIFNLTVPGRLSDLILGKPIPCTKIAV